MSDIDQLTLKIDLLTLLLKIKAGQWDDAHQCVSEHENQPDYDRLHALLHRIEGDEWNAKYWYNKCNSKFPKETIDKEIDRLIKKYSA